MAIWLREADSLLANREEAAALQSSPLNTACVCQIAQMQLKM